METDQDATVAAGRKKEDGGEEGGICDQETGVKGERRGRREAACGVAGWWSNPGARSGLPRLGAGAQGAAVTGGQGGAQEGLGSISAGRGGQGSAVSTAWGHTPGAWNGEEWVADGSPRAGGGGVKRSPRRSLPPISPAFLPFDAVADYYSPAPLAPHPLSLQKGQAGRQSPEHPAIGHRVTGTQSGGAEGPGRSPSPELFCASPMLLTLPPRRLTRSPAASSSSPEPDMYRASPTPLAPLSPRQRCSQAPSPSTVRSASPEFQCSSPIPPAPEVSPAQATPLTNQTPEDQAAAGEHLVYF